MRGDVLQHHSLAEEHPADEQERGDQDPRSGEAEEGDDENGAAQREEQVGQPVQHAAIRAERRDLAALVELVDRRPLLTAWTTFRPKIVKNRPIANAIPATTAFVSPAAVDERLEPADPEDQVLEPAISTASGRKSEADPQEHPRPAPVQVERRR